MERVIRFAYPHHTKSISVTGNQCEQDCAHCGGHYLKAMLPISAMEASSATSFLISGGCKADGTVPIGEHVDQLKK